MPSGQQATRTMMWKAGMFGAKAYQFERSIDMILDMLGMELTETNRDQCAVMIAAMIKFDERNNGQYHDLWREYGAGDTLHHVRSKSMRTKQMVEALRDGTLPDGPGVADVLDDAIDGINYFSFTIRNMLEGRYADG